MKTFSEILKSALLAIALVMTLGSVFAPFAEAVECEPDPGDQCKLSSGDILHDQDEKDTEMSRQ